ncbi:MULTISPECIES: alpha/beta hydrolase [Salimicrobium]|uniref:Lysophospholipase n=2 Tax=Salimicrobium TaxID=351195 RepID=A0ABY1KWV8_9BACI|nr:MULTISPECIES: alpha/beta hydrolase [Salimicrobium]SDY03233.1 lysophospholipase [Salimicrobium album]SIS73063.1 lysophospholipase [Salimicrobium salexigens]
MLKEYISVTPKAVIVVVHGAFEHGGRYRTLAEKFQTDGYSVVVGDLPGQGDDIDNRGHIRSFRQYLDTIEGWVEYAKEVEVPVFLLGHSMGGLAVIRALQEKSLPVQGVILSSPALGIKNGASKPLEAMAKVMDRLSPSLLVSYPYRPETVTRNENVWEQDRKDDKILQKVSVRWYKEFQRAIKVARDKPFSDVPLLLMQAGEDKMVNSEDTKRWFDAQNLTEKAYKEWPGLYHELFNEPEWEEVYRYALSFIEIHR